MTSAPWKEWLLPAYYYGTLPLRRCGTLRASSAGRMPISVLFYHRVADEHPSPWTISTTEFARQMDWLQRHFELISLAEAQRRMDQRLSFRPAVCVTFDDGYAENCRFALPLLISRGVPCTYFVSTQFVTEGQPFPHDVARGEPHAPNTKEQLQAAARAGIEMGAHTRTHADLGPITDPAKLRDEIAGSRADLQDWLGVPVRYFAFPYGQVANLNATAIDVIRATGFAGFCSAYGGYNVPDDDSFHLQRMHGDPNFARFKNWLTCDPRWMRVRPDRVGGARSPGEAS